MRSDTKIPKCHMCGKGPFENLREWVNHRCDRAMSSDTPTPRTRFEIDRCQNELGAIEVGPFIALSKTLERELAEAIEQNRNLLLGSTWVCVHCGYFAKSKDGQNELKAHIAECPNHPMAALKAENAMLTETLLGMRHATCVRYPERRCSECERIEQALASRGRENEREG